MTPKNLVLIVFFAWLYLYLLCWFNVKLKTQKNRWIIRFDCLLIYYPRVHVVGFKCASFKAEYIFATIINGFNFWLQLFIHFNYVIKTISHLFFLFLYISLYIWLLFYSFILFRRSILKCWFVSFQCKLKRNITKGIYINISLSLKRKPEKWELIGSNKKTKNPIKKHKLHSLPPSFSLSLQTR